MPMPQQKTRRKRAAAGKPRPWLPVAVVGVVAIFAVALIVVLSNMGSDSSSPSNTTTNVPAATPGPTHAAPQSATVVGSDSAPVTIVEYFRFDCPHCQEFAKEVEPQLEKDYIASGKLRIEFRPMALDSSSSSNLLNASEAALIAGDQGHFWEYYDLVFANMSRGFSIANLKEYAADLGLDTTAFNSALDSGKYKDQIVNETNEAIKVGVDATPTFFIGKTSDMKSLSVPFPNQNRLGGVQTTNPYAPFKAAIDPLLPSQ